MADVRIQSQTEDQVMESTEGMQDSSDQAAHSPTPGSERANNGHITPGNELGADDVSGLFGSGSEDGRNDHRSKHRKLDDEDLDSGDDEGRDDRVDDEMDGYDEEQPEFEEQILDVEIGRHAAPRPSDGELYLLQFPKFVALEPKAFDHRTFQPPTNEHHSSEPPSSTFSAYETANSTIRWRRSPSDPAKSQSNARILRWSDGSLTLQIASDPTKQYELAAKPLAPPQVNPVKPTPTALRHGRTTNGTTGYDSHLDSHTYLMAPHETCSLIRVTNHITGSLTIQSSSLEEDDALIRLQESLAAATKGNKTAAEGGLGLVSISEDPEMAKKKAEVAEKEMIRAARRRQMQADRDQDRSNRVLGRSGLRTGGQSVGLTVGGLEEDDGMATTRARPTKPKKKPRRRNSEYSDEENFRNRGRTKEDEYDEDDGFLVASDEEPELVADDSEEEAEMDDEAEEADEAPKKKAEPKKALVAADADEGASSGRTKKRRVIDEDEDEE